MTSIDTNVLIALLQGDPASNQIASTLLSQAAAIGPLCICGAVFSELLGFPGRNAEELRASMKDLGIWIEWGLEKADWDAAGIAYQGYVKRRRTNGIGLPRRIATDFIIGAHATVRGYTFLTLDKRLYTVSFPGLQIQSI
jgi:predicted nucleic acid-binding protein